MQLNSEGRSTPVLVPRFIFEQTTSLSCLSPLQPQPMTVSEPITLFFWTCTVFLFSSFITISPPNSSLLATSLLLIPRIDGLPHRLCQVDPVQGHPGQRDPALPLQHWREGRLIRFHHLGTPQGHKESTERLQCIHSFKEKHASPAKHHNMKT